jgi:hypothetical protein
MLILRRTGELAKLLAEIARERNDTLHGIGGLYSRAPAFQVWRLQRRVDGLVARIFRASFVRLHVLGLLRVFGRAQRFIVWVSGVLFFAVVALGAHRFIEARLDSLLNSGLRREGLLILALALYRCCELPLERILDNLVSEVRRWGLHHEALTVYIAVLEARDQLKLVSTLRTRVT